MCNLEERRRGTLFLAFAAVLVAATLDCASRDEKTVPQGNAEEIARDSQALDQLRAAGSNLAKPHHVDFYLYLSAQSDAESAEGTLRSMGYSVTITSSENNINWICVASRTMVPTIQDLTVARGLFNSLATRYQGVYDGWEAGIER